MSWLLGCSSLDPATIATTRSLARQAPGFLWEAAPPGGYLAGGGIPETCRHGDGWAAVGCGLELSTERCAVLPDTAWARRLTGDDAPDLAGIEGHFVAATWTPDAISLYTDTLGVRAAYVAQKDDDLFFGTRPDWLVTLAGASGLDEAAFGAHWLLFNQLQPRSLHAGIRRLRPGDVAHVRSGSLTLAGGSPWLPVLQHTDAETTAHLLDQIVLPQDPEGLELSIGLSGGMDSRLLLALRAGRQPVRLHTFGRPGHPDADMAERLARTVGLPIDRIDAPWPDPTTCLDLIRRHMALTQAVSPASSALSLRHAAALRALGRWQIDGGFGEVARQQYLNRLRWRGRRAMAARDAAGVLPYLRYHRVDLFNPEFRAHLEAGLHDEVAGALASIPPKTEVDDAIDLLSIHARLPHFFGYEQNRLDGEILNYMPFAQPSFLQALFTTPLSQRRHGRLFRELIRSRQPALARYPLVKGSQTYPFGLSPLAAFLWTTLARRITRETSSSEQTRFLRHIEPYVRERARAQAVREDPRIDHPRLLALVDGFYEGQNTRAAEVDWWLALDAWWPG